MVSSTPSQTETSAIVPLAMTRQEVAKFYHISLSVIERSWRAGQLIRTVIKAPGARRGTVRYLKSDVDAWLNSMREVVA